MRLSIRTLASLSPKPPEPAGVDLGLANLDHHPAVAAGSCDARAETVGSVPWLGQTANLKLSYRPVETMSDEDRVPVASRIDDSLD